MTTNTYDVHRLARQDGASATDGSWRTRDAAMFITTDVDVLLDRLKPAVDAGLHLRVMTVDRRPVVIEQRRWPSWSPFYLYRGTESWSVYEPMQARSNIRARIRWDADDAALEARWMRLANGDQVMVWDPVWGRDTLLNRAIYSANN